MGDVKLQTIAFAGNIFAVGSAPVLLAIMDACNLIVIKVLRGLHEMIGGRFGGVARGVGEGDLFRIFGEGAFCVIGGVGDAAGSGGGGGGGWRYRREVLRRFRMARPPRTRSDRVAGSGVMWKTVTPVWAMPE
jgi:hypothetical protein